MSLHRIRACVDTNAKTSTAFLKRGESIANEIEIYLTSNFFFSELKGYLAKPFSKRLFGILSIHLDHLRGCITLINSRCYTLCTLCQ